jgi:SOS-response transcriptional repressor LexA
MQLPTGVEQKSRLLGGILPVTARQLRVREFILAYQEEHGRRPSYKEIMAATNISNRMTVFRYIRRLIRDGELQEALYVGPRRSATAPAKR